MWWLFGTALFIVPSTYFILQAQVDQMQKKKKKGSKNGTVLLTDWPPTNWAGSRLPGIFGLFAVGWDSFSEVEDTSSKLRRSNR